MGNITIDSSLLDELQENLQTSDEDIPRLNRIIREGINYLQDDIAGITLDFGEGSSNRALLMDYCRYSYNNALEYFEENFKRQLLRLQMSAVIKNATNEQ